MKEYTIREEKGIRVWKSSMNKVCPNISNMISMHIRKALKLTVHCLTAFEASYMEASI